MFVWQRYSWVKKWQSIKQISDCALCLAQEYRLLTKLSRSAIVCSFYDACVCVCVCHLWWEIDLSANAKRCLAHRAVWSSSLFSAFPGGMSRKWVFSALSLCRLFKELCRNVREWQRAKDTNPPHSSRESQKKHLDLIAIELGDPL